MKIIAVYGNLKHEAEPGNRILVWPDSVMINTGKPLFLPDDSHRLIPGIGVKIDAVGKSIKPRFAERYYNEVFPLVFVLPSKICDTLLNDEDPYATELVEDYSIIHGHNFENRNGSDTIKLEISLAELKGEGRSSLTLSVDNVPSQINQAIASASIKNTLKTGDIAAFFLPEAIPVKPETLLTVGTAEQDKLIETKFK